jgi:hypothetical protein
MLVEHMKGTTAETLDLRGVSARLQSEVGLEGRDIETTPRYVSFEYKLEGYARAGADLRATNGVPFSKV